MKKPRIGKGLFVTVKDGKDRLHTFEISKNPLYEVADEESEFICHPVLVDQKGAIIPYLSYKMILKKKEFRVISDE